MDGSGNGQALLKPVPAVTGAGPDPLAISQAAEAGFLPPAKRFTAPMPAKSLHCNATGVNFA
ncbi:hypothetical protein CQ13_15720 [Bradyrhizobium retamae]|uniref:Uncharacterized protein n=1 Tax=Bradyrhizobium retamae TaxID=1300035 RepID=A0A0R3NGY7_9BRAD|nr:hypothetical protein CQ13_15720 [Bradyrhizobium retamae]